MIRKHPPKTREGYLFDTQVLRLELYRLLTSILAGEHAYQDSNHITLFDEFQEDQIIIALITIATTVRIIDDREKRYLNRFNTECGQITTWRNKKRETGILKLREACNKIIHAKKVRFEVFDSLNSERLKPIVHFYGVQDKKKWKATVELLKFIEKVEGFVYT